MNTYRHCHAERLNLPIKYFCSFKAHKTISSWLQVKVLYVRNLTSSVSEDKLREVFEAYGKIDRVKKIKDYAFVHFDDREQASQAMAALNHQELNGSPLEISLAKPPSDKKKKEEMLRKREQRMMRAMSHGLELII